MSMMNSVAINPNPAPMGSKLVAAALAPPVAAPAALPVTSNVTRDLVPTSPNTMSGANLNMVLSIFVNLLSLMLSSQMNNPSTSFATLPSIPKAPTAA